MLGRQLGVAAAAALVLWAIGSPASALSMADCSAKYNAAKTAGTLNGMSWKDFRKAQCGAAADTSTAKAATAAAPAPAADTSEPTAANTENAAEPAAPKVLAPKNVVFPTGLSSKYSSETPAKARMHTCLDQYKADKAKNALGGMTWIQKGGGYYSVCNAKLKG
ncbi:MAG: hypothetical protein JSR87_11130 [Proteobacteria bacterium]|nr:hypothetical protein [Pseudomonadota bacterium]MBS0572542.1 hypothetical protein [Pseudomonadota bacterium]